jgi:hypothetical protein
MPQRPQVDLLRRYWLFAGAAFALAAATMIARWVVGG